MGLTFAAPLLLKSGYRPVVSRPLQPFQPLQLSHTPVG